jgi:HAE1 family hydrophobic/amphiphilic exporter-1
MLSRLAVRRPITTLMVVVAAVLLGWVSFQEIPVQLFPDITYPGMGIWAGREGTADTLMEKLTKPLEEIAAQLPRVKEIRSSTWEGGCWIQIEFEHGTPMRFTVLDAEERINRWLRTQQDRRIRVQAFPFSTEDFQKQFMSLRLLGADTTRPLSRDVLDRVEQSLKAIHGVAKVDVRGEVHLSARILFDPDRLKAYGIGFDRVVGAVSAAAAEQPDLGRIENEESPIFVRIGDRIHTLEQLREIPLGDKGALRLEDVADVIREGVQDQYVFRVNGKKSVWINMEKEAGVNLIQLARKVRDRVAELNKVLPTGYELAILYDDAEVIETIIREMSRQALIGVLLAALVPLFFLRSFRMASIIFLTVPVSLIATFNLMYGYNLSLNILTIVGLAIGVSILVDNSIVVVENGFRLAERGMPPLEAAQRGGEEVGKALMASTATTIVVFLPIFFSDGPIRIIFREGAFAVAFPLIISLAAALTLVPVLTARALWLRMPGQKGAVARWWEHHVGRHVRRVWPYKQIGSDHARSLFREAYRAVLKRALRHRGRTLAIVAGLCIFTFMEQHASVQRTVVRPETRREHLGFHLVYPRGTRLSQVDAAVRHVEDRLNGMNAIKRYYVYYNDDQAYFSVRLKPIKERPEKITWEDFRLALFEEIGPVPGAVLSFQGKQTPQQQQTLPMGEGGEVELRGPDLDVLIPMGERVRQALLAFPGIAQSELDLDTDNPEIEVRVDRERSAIFDINAQTVAQYIASTQRQGTLASIRLEDGDQRTDIVFEMGGPQRETLEDIRSLPVFSPLAGAVPLSEVASMRRSTSNPSYFYRVNRQDLLRVRFFVRPGTTTSELSEGIKKVLRSLPNPGGIAISMGGEIKQQSEREEQAGWMLQLGVVFVFMVMAFIFESYWIPLVILFSIPLISIGVIWALLLGNRPMDELAMFGVLLLAGLVVNGPIVMLDLCQRLRKDHGYGRTRALFQACDQRLRPVCMTVLTTVLGLLPLALRSTENNEWSGLALTVIGGLISSTLLTLLFIPCAYMVVEDGVVRIAPAWYGFWRIVAFVYRRLCRVSHFIAVEAPIALWKARLWRIHRWPVWAWRAIRFSARTVYRALRWTLRVIRNRVVNVWTILRWVWRLFVGLLRPRKAPEIVSLAQINRELPPGIERLAEHPSYCPEAPPLATQSLRVIFPVRRAAHLLHAVPSRRYAIGCRPLSGVTALDGIDLDIPRGLFGLLGPNGAGKTTLLRCLAGLLPPTRGTVRVLGIPLRDSPEAPAALIGYLPQYHGLYDHMTLRQYLEYFLLLRIRARQSTVERAQLDRAVAAAADEVHLLDALDKPLGHFSGGMRQRAGLARVLLGAPPIVLVDEPTAGLDPVERVKVRLLLAQLAQTRTVIFSTHLVEDLELTCQAVGILQKGKLLFAGQPADLLQPLQGRLWEVPVRGDQLPGELNERITAQLFRVARADGMWWRCIAPSRPSADSRPTSPRLEDAFLSLLGETSRQSPAQ